VILLVNHGIMEIGVRRIVLAAGAPRRRGTSDDPRTPRAACSDLDVLHPLRFGRNRHRRNDLRQLELDPVGLGRIE